MLCSDINLATGAMGVNVAPSRVKRHNIRFNLWADSFLNPG